MSVRESANVLLSNKDKAADWIALADGYIQQFNSDPHNFILPKAYAFIKPLIETYHDDLGGFVKFVEGVRDSMVYQSPEYRAVHAMYRRINGRHVQQQRRDRAARAVQKAEQLYGQIPYLERQVWLANLEHKWAQRRLDYLDRLRGSDRLTTEERTNALEDFWRTIDLEIENGEIPKWH